jgi:hypothetical protein
MDIRYNYSVGAGDNGNVIGITNNRDTTRSQQFTYDQVNRLVTGETTSTYSTSATNCWGEAYVHDNQPAGGEFGNLANINAASTAYSGCTQESLGVTAGSQNQITTFSYDAVLKRFMVLQAPLLRLSLEQFQRLRQIQRTKCALGKRHAGETAMTLDGHAWFGRCVGSAFATIHLGFQNCQSSFCLRG